MDRKPSKIKGNKTKSCIFYKVGELQVGEESRQKIFKLSTRRREPKYWEKTKHNLMTFLEIKEELTLKFERATMPQEKLTEQSTSRHNNITRSKKENSVLCFYGSRSSLLISVLGAFFFLSLSRILFTCYECLFWPNIQNITMK